MSDPQRPTPSQETEPGKSIIPAKKKTFWPKFLHFLSMGGFILVLFVVLGIVLAVAILFKCK